MVEREKEAVVKARILEILAGAPDGWGAKSWNIKARLRRRYKIDLDSYVVNGILKRLLKEGTVESFLHNPRGPARWRLKGWTQEEIGEALGLTQNAISVKLSKMPKLAKLIKTLYEKRHSPSAHQTGGGFKK